MPEVILAAEETHPNKHPVSIKLFPVDTPSDGAPFGAMGRRILVPHDVAERYLHTLEGMALNAKNDLAGHDPQAKIGVIMAARISDGWAIADGHLFSYDHPALIEQLHALSSTGDLGASFESTHTAGETVDGVWQIKEITFTGATLMMRRAAAWQSTSVAAASTTPPISPQETNKPMADTPNTAEQTPQAPAFDMAALTGLFTQLTSAVTSLTEKVGSLQAAAVPATPAPSAPVAPETPAVDPAVTELKTKLEEMTGRLQAAEDKLKKPATAPQRRTFGPTNLLARHGIQAGSSDLSTAMTQIEDLVSKGVITRGLESMQAKLLARANITE